jgi:hypothetical protein
MQKGKKNIFLKELVFFTTTNEGPLKDFKRKGTGSSSCHRDHPGCRAMSQGGELKGLPQAVVTAPVGASGDLEKQMGKDKICK